MSLTSGFFNSVNSDRLYDAEQMSMIFDGIINDGIYDSIGTAFALVPASGMTVNVGIGRAWLNHTWVYNDSLYPITLADANASLNRIDTVCIKVDHSLNVRAASIVVLEGTPAAEAVAPAVPADDDQNGVYYHKIADISVAAAVTEITAAMITSYIGLSGGVPYVTGIIASTTFDQLWNQLEGEFEDWWETVKNVLDGNVAARLQNEIDHLTPKEATMNQWGLSHIDPPPAGKTYAAYSVDEMFKRCLTTETKDAIGLPAGSTPDDAFAALCAIINKSEVVSTSGTLYCDNQRRTETLSVSWENPTGKTPKMILVLAQMVDFKSPSDSWGDFASGSVAIWTGDSGMKTARNCVNATYQNDFARLGQESIAITDSSASAVFVATNQYQRTFTTSIALNAFIFY